MLIEKYWVWRDEILKWDIDFFNLAIEKMNVDWKIKKEIEQNSTNL